MFSGIKNFLSRHKRKFIATGVIVGGSVLAVQYAQRKLREFQEAQAREFIERTRRTQHFESTERTCNQAIMGVAGPLCAGILQNLDTQHVLDELRNNPNDKQALWHELKVLAFTRIATLVYACSMLVVSLRIQLNILGGYLYKEKSSAGGAMNFSAAMQQSYLSLNQHFQTEGCARMARLIESKVRTILADYDLRQPLSLAEVEQIFWSIQMAVNSDDDDPSSAMGRYVMPSELSDADAEQMSKLFAETLDMLEAEDSAALNTYNVTRGFTIVMDSIAEFYYEPMKRSAAGKEVTAATNLPDVPIVDITDMCNGNGTAITRSDLNAAPLSASASSNINNVKIPMAKLIPIVNGLAGKAFSSVVKPPSLSTSLVTLFLVSDKVKTLGANVYEVFSE